MITFAGSVPDAPSLRENARVSRSTTIIGPYSGFPHSFPASSAEAMRALSKTSWATAIESAATIMPLRRACLRGGNVR